MNSRFQYVIAFLLILLAAFSRLIPHPMNFAPIAAIALFGGVYFNKKFALIVPLSALLISDYFLGFYSGMIWVYGSFLAIGVMGIWLKNHKSVGTIIGTTFAGSIIFFAVTNFGVWASGYYPQTVDGLISCYAAAIPFYRNSLAGDLFYAGVLFGSFELMAKYVFQKNLVQA